MKRYEKMSKEEIIKAFTILFKCDEYLGYSGIDDMTKWLNEELDRKPRIETINTEEELIKAVYSYRSFCSARRCSNCELSHWKAAPPIPFGCLIRYLSEEIEVSSDEQTN